MEQSLSAPARLLVDAVEALRQQVAVELPGPQALAETSLLLREAGRLQAVLLARLADVDHRELHDLDGAPSTSSWVACQQADVDRSLVALARRLDQVPLVAEAVGAGLLPMSSAVRLEQALRTCRPHVDRSDGLIDGHPAQEVLDNVVVEGVLFQLAESRGGLGDDDPELAELLDLLAGIARSAEPEIDRLEAAFLVLAQRLEPGLLAQALTRLVDAVLPQQLEDRAERAHRNRAFSLTLTGDGAGYRPSGLWDLELGELVLTAVRAAEATDPAGPGDTAAWAARRGEPVPAVEETAPAPRSRAQRAHDGLKLAVRRLLDTGALGTRGKTAPHLLVTVGLAALHDQPGALPAVTAGGTTLPVGLVRRLVCDSRLTRLVLSAGRRVLETSHTARTLTAHERHVLHAQWGGRCAGAGCTTPPGSPLVPHHADPWHRSGTTSLAETVPLCDSTHHDLHEGGRTIRLRDGRRLGPEGWAEGPSG